jgi:hypothetical protein
MTTSAETALPQVLLAHHLKTLKLPTFLREYDKLVLPVGEGDSDDGESRSQQVVRETPGRRLR